MTSFWLLDNEHPGSLNVSELNVWVTTRLWKTIWNAQLSIQTTNSWKCAAGSMAVTLLVPWKQGFPRPAEWMESSLAFFSLLIYVREWLHSCASSEAESAFLWSLMRGNICTQTHVRQLLLVSRMAWIKSEPAIWLQSRECFSRHQNSRRRLALSVPWHAGVLGSDNARSF
jgi:hypothetical protein